MNNYALRDKEDAGGGLELEYGTKNEITTYVHQINVDTRDCIGVGVNGTLNNARLAYELSGGRGELYGNVVGCTGIDISPIVLKLVPLTVVSQLKNGDTLIIKEVTGVPVGLNMNANGEHKINNINYITGEVELVNTRGNGLYKGGGEFFRITDSGYPKINEYSNIIDGNQIIVQLSYTLKDVRNIIVDYVTIPRDIIPIQTYMIDLVEASTNMINEEYTNTATLWTSFIPQEADYMESQLLGFYSTPLEVLRSYVDGYFSLQDAITPPPLKLWNPPIGPWPLQPLPYPFQTVPTYVSNDFTVVGKTGLYHLVLGGYGVYDFKDWTSNTGVPVTDAAITSIVRKLLLLLVIPNQSYNNVSYIEMILNCNTVTPGNYVSPFGYGDFQRFIPGPGIQLNYQPGTSDGVSPTVSSVDNPVPFPDFCGNVWGPYDNPEAHFQKLGLRSTLQDLFLNGDTKNLFGNPIIKPNVPTEDLMNDVTFGLNFSIFNDVTLNNISAASNLNILNAMRITSNGFGAVVVRASGSGNPNYVNEYQQAGGQGPSTVINNGQWVNTGVYGGTGDLTDPIATGPSSSNNTAQTSDPNNNPSYRYSWSDSGTNAGQFITLINNYVDFTINDVQDSDFVMYIEEAKKTERSLSTNNYNVDANFMVPMRLNLGTPSGTLQYVESVYSLIAGSDYWNKRFLVPKGVLKELHISCFTYDGEPINLEKMLQRRKSTELLQLFSVYITNNINLIPNLTNFNFFFLFDPFNPTFNRKMKRYIQMIIKAECYQYVNSGLVPNPIGPLQNSLLNPPSSIGPNTISDKFGNPLDDYNNFN